MGWNNPPMPWRELEGHLTGRSIGEAEPGVSQEMPQGDGGDAPGWSRKRQSYVGDPITSRRVVQPYAELHAHSSFSFLDGASHPEELVEEAARLGMKAIALTDHDGVHGIVRFAEAARTHGMPTIYGSELSLDGAAPTTSSGRLISARSSVPDPAGRHLLVLARDPHGYAALTRQISNALRRGGSKGHPVYDIDELTAAGNGAWFVLTGCRKGALRAALEAGKYGTFALDDARLVLIEMVERFGRDNVAVELTYARDPLADERYDALTRLAIEQRLPVVATTAAHYHAPARRPLATAMAAIRARSSLDELNGWLPAWADAHLRDGDEMVERFARWPGAVATAAELGAELAFDLTLVAPTLPPFPVPDGHTEMTYLRHLAYAGAERRYGSRTQVQKAYEALDHELHIIEKLGFPGYFLVVWDIVEFCRRQGILCQGRGSAANSAVCYAIGITAVDPVGYGLLFERFLSPERGEPPDIDVDIESDRREEAIQHVYERYGRDYAAQVANVITYRPRSAVRDIAKSLGYATGQQDAWSKEIDQSYYWALPKAGEPKATDDHGIPVQVLELAEQLQNHPRHLGIHSGGMVICDRPIVDVCPVEWGRMPNRTVLQWDKDDCAAIGLVKFDLLGLGMLSALKYTFDLVADWHGTRYDLDSLPKEQSCVYDMLCEADSVGVFQVESRAQMATLPRLRPRKFYDLVTEIALIRPGPIQGDSVHPFIRRKRGLEEITYPHPKLIPVLERTLGVPLFQEQLMLMAVHAADFTPAEADQLRRAVSSKRSDRRIEELRERLYAGMARNGITGQVADDIYRKIRAFAAFGFAESHSISFALLVYASSWLKRHYPAAFCAALLNAQPMGFYSPQSLIHDARRHGVHTRTPDVNLSLVGASLEKPSHEADMQSGCESEGCSHRRLPQPAIRLGLSSVRGIRTELATGIVDARRIGGPFSSQADLAYRVGLSTEQLEALATAGAFDSLDISRRNALWNAAVAAVNRPGQLDLTMPASTIALPSMGAPEQLLADLWATGTTPGTYPTQLIRPQLRGLGVTTAGGLPHVADRTRVTVAGIVTHRQRPATAGGITFINLEDETGLVNIVCHPGVWSRCQRTARQSGGLLIRGMLERADGVVNVVAEHITKLPLGLRNTSRDFR